jgi:hypothetical protein
MKRRHMSREKRDGPSMRSLVLLFGLTACSSSITQEAPSSSVARQSEVQANGPIAGPIHSSTDASVGAATEAATTRSATPREPSAAELERYAWLTPNTRIRSLEDGISPPAGFRRVDAPPHSFAAFLRGLPLRAVNTPVLAFDRSLLHEGDDRRVAAVAELDVSPVDLQQCADSVIRLHAEWLWTEKRPNDISYQFVSGDRASWLDYAAGSRPKVDGARVKWSKSAQPDTSRGAFRRYLDLVFMYASTISLARSTKPVATDALVPGDFFVLPGGPGHAILILDIAINASGERVALLGQGFMPAQDFHVLNSGESFGPWFALDSDVMTPFWPAPFPEASQRRFEPVSAH